ncbi:hypothetical protein HYH03_010059 [Edaphochlamys debaryana]|uniref:Uncharacterized protein n=1 Tax=Edaphochlamys debaryana TaxID=47281 RepID=A0A835Y090_9CHLO|nr:hypothetical protein HYH03_010059 [Edaphochlamys debaryana]|eukprot:KAG2491691.1 hypothetical protein HYH03_010059 [Edaphochlamys debaryana]
MVNAPKPLVSGDTCRPSTVRRAAGCLARCGLFAALAAGEADDYCNSLWSPNRRFALMLSADGGSLDVFRASSTGGPLTYPPVWSMGSLVASVDPTNPVPYALLINPNGTWSIWASTPVSYGNGSFAAGNWTNEVLLSSSSSRAPIIGTSISYPEFALVSLGPWSLALSDAGQPRLVSANGSVAWEASFTTTVTAPSAQLSKASEPPAATLASALSQAATLPSALAPAPTFSPKPAPAEAVTPQATLSRRRSAEALPATKPCASSLTTPPSEPSSGFPKAPVTATAALPSCDTSLTTPPSEPSSGFPKAPVTATAALPSCDTSLTTPPSEPSSGFPKAPVTATAALHSCDTSLTTPPSEPSSGFPKAPVTATAALPSCDTSLTTPPSEPSSGFPKAPVTATAALPSGAASLTTPPSEPSSGLS